MPREEEEEEEEGDGGIGGREASLSSAQAGGGLSRGSLPPDGERRGHIRPPKVCCTYRGHIKRAAGVLPCERKKTCFPHPTSFFPLTDLLRVQRVREIEESVR